MKKQIKTCKRCGKEFSGVIKEVVCADCKRKLWFGTEEARIK